MSTVKEANEQVSLATVPDTSIGAEVLDMTEALPEGRCILFATNGSAESDAALRFAAALAWREELSLRALTVVEPLPALPAQPSVAAYQVTIETGRAEQLLDRVRNDLAALPARGAVVTTMLVGSPGAAIADAARQWHAEYIILGAGRHGRLERLLTGDTVVRVMRHATVPVIAVPSGCDALPRNGLVAVDFGPASVAAARSAAAVLGAGSLHLVHVRPEFDIPATDPNAWAEVYESGAAALMQRIVGELRQAHPELKTTTTLLRGHPAKVLLDRAKDVKADLIALGQHGHGTVERFLFGSVAHAIVRSANCAVLVAPPIAGA
jgi:nucleotide-binding universal stress UspA family protein